MDWKHCGAWKNWLGLNIDHVQTDRLRPTGSVKVQLDGNGLPRFEIAHPVAWDFMEWSEAWQHLAEKADAVCFGSLAQRSEVSRSIILHFLQAMCPRTVKIFDANLRQSYYSPEVLTQSMRLADIAKLNDRGTAEDHEPEQPDIEYPSLHRHGFGDSTKITSR